MISGPAAFADSWHDILDSGGVRALSDAAGRLAPMPSDGEIHDVAASYMASVITSGDDRESCSARLLDLTRSATPSIASGRDIRTAAAHIHVLVEHNRASHALAAARQYAADAEMLTAPEFAEARSSLPWLWIAVAHALQSVGEDREASRFLRRAESGSLVYTRLTATAGLAVAFALGGLSATARDYLDRFTSLADANPAQVSRALRSLAATGTGVLAGMVIDVAGALRSSDEGRAVSPGAERDFDAWSIRGHAMRMQGRAREAVDELAPVLAEQSGPSIRPRSRAGAEFAFAAALVAAGHPGVLARGPRSRDHDPRHHSCYAALQAVAYLSVGMPHAALRHTDPCLELGSDHNLRTLPESLVVRAAALRELDRPGASTRVFGEALGLVRTTGPASFTYIPKPTLASLIDLVAGRGIPVPHDVRSILELPVNPIDGFPAMFRTLTAREREILSALDRPETISGLARALHLSHNTMRVHTKNIYRKFGVRSRAEAVRFVSTTGYDLLRDADSAPA